MGVVVTAGTGSGKLFILLAALIEISKLIDDHNWVKAFAVYPRTELLKDQFMEAYKLARKMDTSEKMVSKLELGLILEARQLMHGKSCLAKLSDGVMPWLTCPECDNKLIWKT